MSNYSSDDLPKIVDFIGFKNTKLQKGKRTFLRHSVGNQLAPLVTIREEKEKALTKNAYSSELSDISYSGAGLLLQAHFFEKELWKEGDSLRITFSFSPGTYIEILAILVHTNSYMDERGKFTRLGVEFDTSFQSLSAIRCYVDFLGSYTQHSLTSTSF